MFLTICCLSLTGLRNKTRGLVQSYVHTCWQMAYYEGKTHKYPRLRSHLQRSALETLPRKSYLGWRLVRNTYGNWMCRNDGNANEVAAIFSPIVAVSTWQGISVSLEGVWAPPTLFISSFHDTLILPNQTLPPPQLPTPTHLGRQRACWAMQSFQRPATLPCSSCALTTSPNPPAHAAVETETLTPKAFTVSFVNCARP